MSLLVLGAGPLGNGVSYSLPATHLSSNHGQNFDQREIVAALADKGEEVSCRPPEMEAQRSPPTGSDPPPQSPFRLAEVIRLP